MDEFNAAKWTALSVRERIEFCRKAARRAEADAKMADPACKETHQNLAEQWRLLAAEIEHNESSKQTRSGIIH